MTNWGKLSKACSFRCPRVPPSSEIKMLLSSGYREGPFHMRVLRPASGDSQKVLPVPVISLIAPAKNIQYAMVPHLGVACPDFCQPVPPSLCLESHKPRCPTPIGKDLNLKDM